MPIINKLREYELFLNFGITAIKPAYKIDKKHVPSSNKNKISSMMSPPPLGSPSATEKVQYSVARNIKAKTIITNGATAKD